jgi:hypothetical protein
MPSTIPPPAQAPAQASFRSKELAPSTTTVWPACCCCPTGAHSWRFPAQDCCRVGGIWWIAFGAQNTERRPEIQFRVSSLKAARYRGVEQTLRLGAARAFTEEIGVAPEVFDRWERDGVDPILDRRMTSSRKGGDPMGECSDELIERVGRQRPVDPAIALGEVGVVVVRGQHDLERPAATHSSCEVLDCPTPPGSARTQARTGRRSPSPWQRSAGRTRARARSRPRVRALRSARS